MQETECYDVAMFSTKTFLALFFLSSASIFSSLAQETEPVPPPWQIGAPAPASVPPREIHVNRDCLILPAPADRTPRLDLQLRHDAVVCHLEAQLNSQHKEEMVVGDELLVSKVKIQEQEYILQNITTGPVVFVVEHHVPEKWRIDSDPLPEAYEGPIAFFRINAAPSEIVRLHVGMRHVAHQSTRHIRG